MVSPLAAKQARHEFDGALKEVEKRLKKQPYLVGEQFSRADVTASSMLSLLVLPPEHPLRWQEIPEGGARQFLDDYREHPVSCWVRKMYKEYRKPLIDH